MISQLKNISKSYTNNATGIRQEVLSDITFSVDKGDSVVITGPSGSGKSTLLNIMGAIDTPTSGNVYFKGKDLVSYGDDMLAEIRNRKIGFIFQSHYLLPQLNILDNVLLPVIPVKDRKYKDEARNRALELIDRVNLSNDMNKFPNQLSGGECQRVAVVRSLINNPELILADEPTGSLDEESADNIGGLLKNIQQENNIALVVVTHSLKLAKQIGTNYRLTGGKLIQQHS